MTRKRKRSESPERKRRKGMRETGPRHIPEKRGGAAAPLSQGLAGVARWGFSGENGRVSPAFLIRL
jgi:hypothetical protein